LKPILFVVSSLIFVMTCEANGLRTVGEVEHFIRESLPVGSDRVSVIQFLSDRGIETSGLQARSGTVYAIIQKTSGGPPVRSAIAMEFFFDDGGRLVRHVVREVSTGP
jgi:hypothetical protein